MNPLLTIYFYFNKIFRSNSCDFYKIKSWLFTLGMIALGTTVGWGQTTVFSAPGGAASTLPAGWTANGVDIFQTAAGGYYRLDASNSYNITTASYDLSLCNSLEFSFSIS